jgi:alpha-1,3-rhamnosyl/mannosyltransferase
MVNMKLSILADQLGGGAGGGRFTTGFLRALFSDSDALERFEKLFVLVTENQVTSGLGPLPPQARVIRRRFPSRLRHTFLAACASRLFPPADIAHGLFYYVFPTQGKRKIITLHDASFLSDIFHSPKHNEKILRLVTQQVEKCDAVVCDSKTVLLQIQKQWPQMAHKFSSIYLGADGLSRTGEANINDGHNVATILAVGTIEPRKNYATLLDAYQHLRAELGHRSPHLVIVGQTGWMSEEVCRRLATAASRGELRWVQNTADIELARLYQNASLFTYLSFYEGFGYPPFEAAYAQVPMVVSSESSVGEIWSGYAKCVKPTDIHEIVSGWKWGLELIGRERQAVVELQKKRATEFTWKRCITEYMQLYEKLAQ